MSQLRVIGGRRLEGSVTVSGTKNAALPILFATVLAKGESTIRNVPNIRDVDTVLDLLRTMGASVSRGQGWVRINTERLHPLEEDARTENLRGSLYLLGSSVARFGEVSFGKAGGCDFGGRPFDYHVRLLEEMGCRTEWAQGRLTVNAKELRGCCISLPYPSVGATCNAILAAMGAEGETALLGGAEEPHVMELCEFLRGCGASIEKKEGALFLAGGNLHGGDYTLSGDAIEAGTYLAAALATGGSVAVEGFCPAHLGGALDAFRNLGAELDLSKTSLFLRAPREIQGIALETGPFPGFPTDLHPVFSVLLALSKEGGHIRETVFRQRFRYLQELKKMGAHICQKGAEATLRGGDKLRGARVFVPDLRGGAALLLAALCAEGETRLFEAQTLARGYAELPEKLRRLGAQVQ